MKKRYTLAVDFDGVVHRYRTPWVAPHIIPDEPVGGAIKWLSMMVQHFDIVIFSTRCKTWRGRRAVRCWLYRHAGLLWYESPGGRGLEEIRLAAKKPPALIYLDDRAVRFEGPGMFPTRQDIKEAVPWHGGAKREDDQ